MNWRELDVWKESHNLVLDVYKTTSSFPDEEKYGITSQLRRCSSSIPSNIVEGQSRDSTKDYLKFLYNSRGSLEETRYFILLSRDLSYISEKKLEELNSKFIKVSKMLNGLIKSLRRRIELGLGGRD